MNFKNVGIALAMANIGDGAKSVLGAKFPVRYGIKSVKNSSGIKTNHIARKNFKPKGEKWLKKQS